MIENKRNAAVKTSKGYRLKNSTHNMIAKIQLMINSSKDTVISRALKLYLAQLNNNVKLSFTEKKKHSKKHKHFINLTQITK